MKEIQSVVVVPKETEEYCINTFGEEAFKNIYKKEILNNIVKELEKELVITYEKPSREWDLHGTFIKDGYFKTSFYIVGKSWVNTFYTLICTIKNRDFKDAFIGLIKNKVEEVDKYFKKMAVEEYKENSITYKEFVEEFDTENENIKEYI